MGWREDVKAEALEAARRAVAERTTEELAALLVSTGLECDPQGDAYAAIIDNAAAHREPMWHTQTVPSIGCATATLKADGSVTTSNDELRRRADAANSLLADDAASSHASHQEPYMRRAFTLIELIIAIAIITVIAAVAIPAMVAAKRPSDGHTVGGQPQVERVEASNRFRVVNHGCIDGLRVRVLSDETSGRSYLVVGSESTSAASVVEIAPR